MITCAKCDKTFKSKSSLSSHIKNIHSGEDLKEKAFKCDRCDLTFYTVGGRRYHKKTVHGDDKPFSCEICGKSYANKEYKHTHVRRTHWKEGVYFCPVKGCGRSCATKTMLKVHKQTHLPLSKRKKFPCPRCPRSFMNLNSLKTHSKLHIGKGIKCQEEECDRTFATMTEMKRHSTIHSEERPHHCDVVGCDRKFKRAGDCSRHKQLVHSTDEDVRIHLCSICSRGFKSRNHMKRHEKTHQELEKFKCPHCPKEYSWNETLVGHIRSEHQGKIKKRLSCSLCIKSFLVRSHLLRHLRDTHGPGENLKCMFCSKVYRTPEGFHLHVRGHTGERPERCVDCGKTFPNLGNLYGHRKVHHTQRSLHQCPHCPKQFLEKCYLKNHVEGVHNNTFRHNCGICGFGCIFKVKMQEHMWAVHTKEKPYKCKVPSCSFESAYVSCFRKHIKVQHNSALSTCYFCSQDFSISWINYHLTLHTKELPFKCRACPKRYMMYVYRTYHEKNDHKL